MQNINDYRCPPGCPERRPGCQESCERYANFYRLNEERKQKLASEKLTFSEALNQKINNNKRFY